MKKFSILLLCIIFLIPGCGAKTPETVYPDYSESLESDEITMEAQPISPHRLLVTFNKKQDSRVYVDATFALYYENGEAVPVTKNLFEFSSGLDSDYPIHPNWRMGITLSLLYDTLKPGRYRLVKRLVTPTDYTAASVPSGEYVSATFELKEEMTPCDYEADPIELSCVYCPEKTEELLPRAQAGQEGQLRLFYENTSDLNWRIDDPCYLYREIEGDWFRVRPETYLTGDLVFRKLAPGESCELSYDLFGAYGELSKGTYRIVRQAWCLEKSYIRVWIGAEFVI